MNLKHNCQVIRRTETDSTNVEAKRLGTEWDQWPMVAVVADYQTAGRGQKGTHWESAPGQNLLFSIRVFPTFVPVERQFCLSQVMSLAVCMALQNYAEGFTVKWPNDVYYRDRKVCGMLIENELSGHVMKRSILGVGVNVNQETFCGDAPNPVSLFQITGRTTDREKLLDEILSHFQQLYQSLQEGKGDEVTSIYLKHLFRYRERHSYRDAEGVFSGAIVGVEADGHLLMDDEDGRRRRYAFKEVKYLFQNRESN